MELLAILLPTLTINLGDPILIGDFWGFVLAVPLALFAIFWVSAVTIRNTAAAITGAFIGAFIGFLIIFAWVGTLFFDTPMAHVDGGSTFFGSVLFCSAMGLVGGIVVDLLIFRATRRAYRNQHDLSAEH